VKLLAVGDISLQTRNNRHPFEKVKQILASKDFLFGNLETVLSTQGEKAQKAVLIYSPPERVECLKDADFDIINIANNHIMDLGIEGFTETLRTLNESNLTFIGASNRPEPNWAIMEKGGVKLGFLGYYEGGFSLPEKGVWINRIELADITRDIESIKPKCNFITVSLHWGFEKVFYPSPKQIDLAHRLIDAGATVVLGHHPHVIQGIEKYKGGVIAYSLGNFQFGFNAIECQTERNKRANQSIVLLLEIGKDGLESYETIPLKIDEDFIPSPVTREEQEEMLHFISEISQPLNSGNLSEKWWFEEIAAEYLSGNTKSFIIRVKKYGVRHLLQGMIWLISPFCLRCYVAIIRRRLGRF